MAESLSHKFGQIIGELLEIALQPNLEKFAKKHKLFLDKKGERLVRKGKKLTWVDIKNNHNKTRVNVFDCNEVEQRGEKKAKCTERKCFDKNLAIRPRRAAKMYKSYSNENHCRRDESRS